MEILYIIPARGGSKGLPGKNIRLLNGKPLIEYSILAAQNSKFPGKILVSTDDAEIANVAKKFGADVPFVRPAELANDTAATIDVILHAINYYKEQHVLFDVVVLLQPTSPLRLAEDIDRAFLLMNEKNAGAVVSVCESEHHPYWTNTLPEDGSMKNFIRVEAKGKNRQQLPTNYRLNGALYISKIAVLEKQKGFIHDETVAYIMPSERSVDIDHEIDFKLAALLLNNK
jgi:N-acylneuraminate cytidylyltransferase/CMP-N,N'-diacetyllegionaminic acid synthase